VATDPLTGKQLGPYKIIRFVGRGGFAWVYEALHEPLGRRVALKVLLPNLAEDSEFVDRFLREARIAAKLEHPNIVTVYDVDQKDGYYYIAMTYVDGQSLHDLLSGGKTLNPQRALGIVSQVARALDYAHSQGVVHRDVKPSNILIDRNGNAYLTDFGIARASWSTRVTRTGMSIGTPEYMSPEQARGEEVDFRSDLYSLGVVLYEMICGQPPFQGENPLSVLHQIVYDMPPEPRKLNPRIPPAIASVLLRGLEKKVDARFQSGAEMVSALSAALEGKHATASQVRTRTPAPIPVSKTPRLLATAGVLVLAFSLVAILLSRAPEENGGATTTGSGLNLPPSGVLSPAPYTPTPSHAPGGAAQESPTATETHGTPSAPDATPTPTQSLMATSTSTATDTGTRTPTPTGSATATVTPTPTPTGSATPTPTPTPTGSATLTPTPTPTATPTPTGSATPTPTRTPSPTPTPTPTSTPTARLRPPTASLWSDRTEWCFGETGVVYWSTENATVIYLQDEPREPSGSQALGIQETYWKWRLRACNSIGCVDRELEWFTVPRIENVSLPGSVGPGQAFTVRWVLGCSAVGFHKLDWWCESATCSGACQVGGAIGTYECSVQAPNHADSITVRIRASTGPRNTTWTGSVQVVGY